MRGRGGQPVDHHEPAQDEEPGAAVAGDQVVDRLGDPGAEQQRLEQHEGHDGRQEVLVDADEKCTAGVDVERGDREGMGGCGCHGFLLGCPRTAILRCRAARSFVGQGGDAVVDVGEAGAQWRQAEPNEIGRPEVRDYSARGKPPRERRGVGHPNGDVRASSPVVARRGGVESQLVAQIQGKSSERPPLGGDGGDPGFGDQLDASSAATRARTPVVPTSRRSIPGRGRSRRPWRTGRGVRTIPGWGWRPHAAAWSAHRSRPASQGRRGGTCRCSRRRGRHLCPRGRPRGRRQRATGPTRGGHRRHVHERSLLRDRPARRSGNRQMTGRQATPARSSNPCRTSRRGSWPWLRRRSGQSGSRRDRRRQPADPVAVQGRRAPAGRSRWSSSRGRSPRRAVHPATGPAGHRPGEEGPATGPSRDEVTRPLDEIASSRSRVRRGAIPRELPSR